MNKRFFSIFGVMLLLIAFFMLAFPINTYATMPDADTIYNQGKDFTDKGQAGAKITSDQIAAIMKPLASLLLGIGTVVLVAITAVMGVKYMAAAPDVRAKLKTQLIGIAVSAVVLFGAYGIWSIAYNVMTDIVG